MDSELKIFISGLERLFTVDIAHPYMSGNFILSQEEYFKLKNRFTDKNDNLDVDGKAEFENEYCKWCGSASCNGIDDTEYSRKCTWAKRVHKKTDDKNITWENTFFGDQT